MAPITVSTDIDRSADGPAEENLEL